MNIQDAIAIWTTKFDEVVKRVDVLKVAVGIAYSVMIEPQIKGIERLNEQVLIENLDIKSFINQAKKCCNDENHKE